MADQISFDGQVVVITGAGRGIGRAHAIEFARRGARVVVNDVDGVAAEEVVDELGAMGAEALASGSSVADIDGAKALIAAASDQWGAVHAVINNAGVLRTGYLDELSGEAIELVLNVGLLGTLFVSQAVWPIFRSQAYGRLVMTSSAGGLFAMQGESGYAAAKGGVYGLAKALSCEGAPHGILVNTILPMAGTTMGVNNPVPGHADRYPEWAGQSLRPRRAPEAIPPLVALLASRACPVSGEAFSVGFGRFARVFVGESRGWAADGPLGVSAEDVLDHFDQIRDLDGFGVPADIYEEIEFIARSMGAQPASD